MIRAMVSKMPLAWRKTRETERDFERNPHGGSQPLGGADHTLRSPPALPFPEHKQREAHVLCDSQASFSGTERESPGRQKASKDDS